jgi:hypothetical protein
MTSPTISRTAIPVIAAAVTCVTTLAPSDAWAFTRRVPAMSCVSENSENDYTGVNGLGWAKGPEIFITGSSANGPQSLLLFCPIPNDDNLTPNMTTTIHFWGSTVGNPVTAQACIQYYNDRGGACGSGTTVSGTGDYDAAIGDLSVWGYPYSTFEVPYVLVNLPNFNSLRGFWVHN